MGEVRFDSIPAGRHRLQVRKVGFASSNADIVVGRETTGPVFMLERVPATLDTVRVREPARELPPAYAPRSDSLRVADRTLDAARTACDVRTQRFTRRTSCDAMLHVGAVASRRAPPLDRRCARVQATRNWPKVQPTRLHALSARAHVGARAARAASVRHSFVASSSSHVCCK